MGARLRRGGSPGAQRAVVADGRERLAIREKQQIAHAFFVPEQETRRRARLGSRNGKRRSALPSVATARIGACGAKAMAVTIC